MDVLSNVLKKVKLSSAIYFKSDFASPWGLDVSQGPFAQFHIIIRGQCVLKTPTGEIQLFAGDIIAFPWGTGHWLADSANSKRKTGPEIMQALDTGQAVFEGDHISTTLICGHFEFDREIDHPLIKQLPEIIHITDAERKEIAWLENITNLVIKEAGSPDPGSQIIVTKLSEVLFIHMLRAYIQKENAQKSFLAAIEDERIAKALQAIHAAPEKDWQLAALAREAGMSRTGFSNLFRDLVGQTPHHYITGWRMLQAKELLGVTKKSVGEIAEEVGYQSEAAFNRVFKKHVAQTPLKYRQSLVLTK